MLLYCFHSFIHFFKSYPLRVIPALCTVLPVAEMLGKTLDTVPACTEIAVSSFLLLLPFVFLSLLSPSPFPFSLTQGSLS